MIRKVQRPVQYPWGSTCPLNWPKAYAVVVATGWNSRLDETALDVMATICPEIELLESGEVLLNLSRQQRRFGSPVRLVEELKQALEQQGTEKFSIGLAFDPLAALLAARVKRDKVIRIIPAWDAERVMASFPVEELDALLTGVSSYLAQYGYRQLGDLQAMPGQYLTGRYGEMGRALLLLAKGKAVPRHLWHKQIPVLLGDGGLLPDSNAAAWPDIARKYQERLESQLDRLGYCGNEWELSIKTPKMERFCLVPQVEQLELYAQERKVLVRWLVRRIQPVRVQGELFGEAAIPVLEDISQEGASAYLNH